GALFTVTISNSAGSATSSAAMLTVNPVTTTLQITTTQLPGGVLAGAYTSTLAATGGTSPYAWTLSNGALPKGLTLNNAGVISGTPSVAGAFSFTVQVKDAASNSASANLTIN